jgi:hypothetical protein
LKKPQKKNNMKHVVTILCLLLLLAVAGAARAQSFQPYKSGVIPYHGYAYPVVPGTEAWKNIDYPQRVASLQLPADTLQNISTARLLETCLYYPFNIDIFAFDDQIGSFGRVKTSSTDMPNCTKGRISCNGWSVSTTRETSRTSIK